MVAIRAKVTLDKNFGIKTKRKWTSNSNTIIMKENKGMAQEI